MQAFRISAALFGTAVVSLLATVFAINCFVDPYNISLWGTWPRINDRLPALVYQSRLTKAVGLIRYHPNIVLIGSSVVDDGFSVPGSTTRYDARRELLTGNDGSFTPTLFNAGIRGGGTYEALAYLQHAWLNNPQLKRAIVGLEWGLFTDLKEGAGVPPPSPVLGRKSLPVAYFKYLTWTALDDSVRTVQRNQGLEQTGGLRDLIPDPEWIVRKAAANSAPQAVNLQSELAIQARSIAETRAFFFSVATAVSMKRAVQGNPNALVRRDTIENLRKLIDFARQKGIEVTFFVPPQHAVYWAVMQNEGLWPFHLSWLREVGQITPYYDFSGLVDFGPDVDPDFLADPLHFQPRVGDRLLPVLLANRPLGDGADYVTRDHLETAIARRSRRLADWLNDNPYIQDVLARLRERPTEISAHVVENLPTPVLQGFRGFWIMRMLGRYYGLPANQHPFDLLKVLGQKYQPMVTGASADEVVATIRREGLKSWEFAPADLTAGNPIASGAPVGAPERVFDGDPETFWISPQRGADVKGNAWIGYQFAHAQMIGRVRLRQTSNVPYRQDRVMVQVSRDGGVTWSDVLPEPARLPQQEWSDINIPEVSPAALWRVVAMGDNAQDPSHAWTPLEIVFLVRDR